MALQKRQRVKYRYRNANEFKKHFQQDKMPDTPLLDMARHWSAIIKQENALPGFISAGPEETRAAVYGIRLLFETEQFRAAAEEIFPTLKLPKGNVQRPISVVFRAVKSPNFHTFKV